MKKFLFIALLGFSINISAQDYLTKIAEKSCECLKNLLDTVKAENLTMKMGFCMISAAEPYKKQLKKDHDINMDQFTKEEGYRLGQLVGIKLGSICPDVLAEVTKRVEAAKAESGKPEVKKFSGKVIKIGDDSFVSFSIKDSEGKVNKFYWLTFIESDVELVTRYGELSLVDIRVTYHALELYDPKIKEYRSFNVVDKIERLSR